MRGWRPGRVASTMASMRVSAMAACLVACAIAAVSLAQPAHAGPAAPPAYFGSHDVVRDLASGPDTAAAAAAVLNLHAPRRRAHAADVLDVVRRSQARALYKRQTQPKSNTSQSSADNANDKSQSLGYLGDSYYVPLNVSSGSAQMLFVSVDTGSSDLWFVSTSCTTTQCNDDRILKFDQGASKSYHALQISTSANVSVVSPANTTHSGSSNSTSTSKDRRTLLDVEDVLMQERTVDISLAANSNSSNTTTVPFQLQYDDTTTASGILGVDSVALADEVVSDQVFGLVSSTNLSLAEQGISGVLGFGFARGSAIARSLLGQDLQGAVASPLLSSILSTKNESYPFFTLSLSSKTGKLTIGAADATILGAEEDRRQVEWLDVMPFPSGDTALAKNATLNLDGPSLGQYVFWALPMSAAGFNGTSVKMTPTYSQVGSDPIALIDSGTAGILGPLDAVTDMFAQIEGARHVGAGRFVVPCTTQERMFFSFGGRDYTLLPSDYIIGPAQGNPYLCLSWPAAVTGSADGVDWTLGQAFLRTVYSLFSLGIADREAPKIGFYPLNNEANVTATASLFALQPSSDVASFISQATQVLTTLPNSLVPVSTPSSTASYFFDNATTTAALGLKPTSNTEFLAAVPPSTYKPILTASTGDGSLPVLASGSSALPLPSNPASSPSTKNAAAPAALRKIPSTTLHIGLGLLVLCIALEYV